MSRPSQWFSRLVCLFLVREKPADDELSVMLATGVSIWCPAAIAACGAIQGDKKNFPMLSH
jgi:hypothetical protein